MTITDDLGGEDGLVIWQSVPVGEKIKAWAVHARGKETGRTGGGGVLEMGRQLRLKPWQGKNQGR